MLFEWDESKRQANLASILIDFQDTTQMMDQSLRKFSAAPAKTAG